MEGQQDGHGEREEEGEGGGDVISCPVISSDSRESLDHRDPLQFWSLNTSLDIETVILKVFITVSISRLKI